MDWSRFLQAGQPAASIPFPPFAIELALRIQVLSGANELPILGPGRWETYHKALEREAAKAGLKNLPLR
jgi:hypothetical protein